MTNIASAAISFFTTEDAAIAQSDAYKHDSKVAAINADTTRQQGEASDQALERDINATLGTMRASYGGSGVDASQGSPMDVLADSIRRGVLDRATNKYNYEVQASNYDAQSAQLKLQAKNAKRAGPALAASASLTSFNFGNGGTGGLGTAGQTTGSYSQWSGGNSLTGGTYNGVGSTSTGWAGDSGVRNGDNTSTDWPGSGGGWGS